MDSSEEENVMGINQTKYGVHNRLAGLENAVTELKAENANLRVHLKGALETAVNDAKNLIQDSIRVPLDGKDGRNGVDGATGPQGAQGVPGDVLIPNEIELQQAVIDLRTKLKEQHAKFIAVLVERAEGEKKGTWVGQHFAKLLESIRQDIERLK
jgi:hypothetical protein